MRDDHIKQLISFNTTFVFNFYGRIKQSTTVSAPISACDSMFWCQDLFATIRYRYNHGASSAQSILLLDIWCTDDVWSELKRPRQRKTQIFPVAHLSKVNFVECVTIRENPEWKANRNKITHSSLNHQPFEFQLNIPFRIHFDYYWT